MTERTAAQPRERAERGRRIGVAGVLGAGAGAGAVSVFLAQSGAGRGGVPGRADSALPPLDVETGVVHIGVTVDGTVQRSEDGGATWGERATVGGEPEAITVDVRDGKETLYVAATDRGILTSDDQGQTFTTRYPE